MSNLPRVLCVDDEENILKAIQRSLRKKYEIITAGSGREGLAILAEAQEPIPVIVSDMRMPEMNGAQFLEEARRFRPDTVRLLLTGFADLDAVTAAVNKGHIYRFLTKPCQAETLHAAIQDGLRQYELVTAERILLERTLKGSIQAMTDILAIASPEGFGQADRMRALAVELGRQAGLSELWQVEVAAMLSQLGCVTLPPDTAERYFRGENLTPREQEMVARMPAVTCEILAHIPRLEPVLAMLAPEEESAAARARITDYAKAEEVRLARAALKLAGDTERKRAAGWTRTRILDWLRANKDDYDPDLRLFFEQMPDEESAQSDVRGMAVHEMAVGMVLSEDVRTEAGLLLIAAGQEVTVGLLQRIRNFHNTSGLQEPLWVRNPDLQDPVAGQDAPAAAPVVV